MLHLAEHWYEFELNIRDVEVRRSADEGTNFKEVGGSQSLLREDPLCAELHPTKGGQVFGCRDILCCSALHRCSNVVFEPTADGRKVGNDIDAKLTQLVRRSNSRELQQLRRVQ